jgi:pectinesterase
MKKFFLLLFSVFTLLPLSAQSFDNPDTIVVARDGTGQFRTVDEAI